MTALCCLKGMYSSGGRIDLIVFLFIIALSGRKSCGPRSKVCLVRALEGAWPYSSASRRRPKACPQDGCLNGGSCPGCLPDSAKSRKKDGNNTMSKLAGSNSWL